MLSDEWDEHEIQPRLTLHRATNRCGSNRASHLIRYIVQASAVESSFSREAASAIGQDSGLMLSDVIRGRQGEQNVNAL